MKITVNKAAVKMMCFLTVPAASTLGLVHLIAPDIVWGALGEKANSNYLYGDAFMGSVFLAFATTALVGLASHEPAGARDTHRIEGFPPAHAPSLSILAHASGADVLQAVRAPICKSLEMFVAGAAHAPGPRRRRARFVPPLSAPAR